MSDSTRRGRPRLEDRARRRSICTAVTEDEHRRITARCRANGGVSPVLRRVLLAWVDSGAEPPLPPLPPVDLAAAHRQDALALGAQVARLGTNINTIARRLNAMGAAVDVGDLVALDHAVDVGGLVDLEQAVELIERAAARVETVRAAFCGEADR